MEHGDWQQPLDVRLSQLGAASVEYALLVGFIAAVVIATVILLGDAVLGLFERVDWW